MTKRGRTFLITFLVLLLLTAGGLFALFWWLTNGFKSEFKAFTVTVNDKIITTDTAGVYIPCDSTVKVNSFKDYDVQIFAYGTDKNNFSFTIDDEEYEWKDEDDVDFTEAFIIDKSDMEKSFTISYGTMPDMLTAVIPGNDVTLAYDDIENVDLFDLVISSAGKKMTLRFHIEILVDDVAITPPEIVF